jgi:hypothetical protein
VGKHIARKEGPLGDYGAVCPLHTLGEERQIVFDVAGNQMLDDSPLVI